MLYFVYKMKLSSRARSDMRTFWAWLEKRETWFYEHLDMVETVRWYYSNVGDVYTLDCWTGFADHAAFGRYQAALAALKAKDDWEGERVTQEDWWEFLESRLVIDPPVKVGFDRRPT